MITPEEGEALLRKHFNDENEGAGWQALSAELGERFGGPNADGYAETIIRLAVAKYISAMFAVVRASNMPLKCSLFMKSTAAEMMEHSLVEHVMALINEKKFMDGEPKGHA